VSAIYTFGEFRLDVADRRLWRGQTHIHLAPKTFEVLAALASRPNQVLTKSELLERVWPGTFVEEGVLAVNVSALRKVLADGGGAEIETVAKVGYRFVADVRTVTADQPAVAEPVLAAPSRSRTPALVLAATIIAVAGAGWWWWSSRASADRIESIAVLPFTSLAGDASQDHLALGMTDAIIGGLGRAGNLRVPPTATMRHFVDNRGDALAVGRELGVESVLTGSLLRSEDRLRVTLQLSRVSDGVQLWSGRFDEQFTNIFSVQDAITEQVAASLLHDLNRSDDRERRATADTLAYDLYLQGRAAWARRTPETIKRGIALFDQAIARDRDFARAYAGLADAYALTASGLLPSDRFPKARAAAERALALDDSLADAHNALAFISYKWDWQWAQAEREFRRALELDPRHVQAHHWFGEFLSVIGRHESGLQELRRARELDPYSTAIQVDIAAAQVRASQFDAAVKTLEEAAAREPGAPAIHNGLHSAHRAAGRDDDSMTALLRFRELSGATAEETARLRAAFTSGGLRAVTNLETARLLDVDRRGGGGTLSLAATIARNYALVGDQEQALSWLEEATRRRDDGPLSTRVAWYWGDLRNEPRFKAIEKIVGIPPD
jgi:TolB-like protein/DNA-binding winged helix-turn-helix (wHTH) protein/Tfp pilus assembly protein PilF